MSMDIYNKPRRLTNSLYYIFQSVPLRVLAVGMVYAAGYFKINPVWIMFAWGFFKYRDIQKIDKMFKREAAMSVSLRDDRKMVIANVYPTPPWVYFPDTERCEWINRIVSHLWPTVQPWLIDYAKSIFEPSINEALSSFKKNPNFSFENCSLGTVSPRISGIKVYNTEVGDQIMVDVYIYFSSDSVLSFSLMNAKGGIDGFKMKGCLRTIILPVPTSEIPLIGGVELFFLRQPSIDFDLSGVLQVFGIPGLNGILRKTIDTNINQTLVLPNKILLILDDDANVEKLKFPEPVGFLRINVIEAKVLQESDRFVFLGSRNPDAYVTITFGSKTYTSEIVENSRNPMWNFCAEFIIDSFFDDTITITVDRRKGNNLGTLSLELQLVEDMKRFDSWIQLEGVTTGMVHVRAWYNHLESDLQVQTPDNTPVLLVVFVKHAKSLVSKSKIRNAVAILQVGEVTRKSRPVPIKNPAFEEVFSFLVNNPVTEKLQIKLIDEDGRTVLGETDFELKHLLTANNKELINQQLELNGTDETSALSISLRLRVLRTD